MIDFLTFMFSGFWYFVGCMMLLGMVARTICFVWGRFWRHLSIMKHGYPPPHCDADGEFPEKEDDEDK